MRMVATFGTALLLGLGWAVPASSCDVGPFPDAPARTQAEVIAIGQVDSVLGPPGPEGYTAGTEGAQVSIKDVPVGEWKAKNFTLKWPRGWAGDCVYAIGPYLRKGDRVALYLDVSSGETKVVDWFIAEDAVRADPRLSKLNVGQSLTR